MKCNFSLKYKSYTFSIASGKLTSIQEDTHGNITEYQTLVFQVPSSRVITPQHETSDVDGGEERCGILRISRGNTPPTPEVQEGVLHPVSLAIQLPIVLSLYLAVALRRDHRLDAPPAAVCQDLVGVMSPVRQQRPGIHPLDQDVSLAAIRRGTCCCNRSERQTMRIHGQMQFRVEPLLVRPIS